MWNKINVILNEKTPVIVESISYILMEHGALGLEYNHLDEYIDNDENLFGELRELKDPQDTIKAGEICGYFEVEKDLLELQNKLKQVSQIHRIEISALKAEDWHKNWMQYYQIEHLSRFIKIVPVWQDYIPKEYEIAVKLDPGIAFGTGNHQTTRLSSLALELVMEEGNRLVDVGTGSGILSFIAAGLGASQVLGLDLDPQAVQAATDNLVIQDHPRIQKIISNQAIHFKVNDLLKGIQGPVDLVVANILPHILVNLFADASQIIKDKGYLILSGILIDKGPEIEREIADYPFVMTHKIQAGNWLTYIYQKNGEGTCKDIS